MAPSTTISNPSVEVASGNGKENDDVNGRANSDCDGATAVPAREALRRLRRLLLRSFAMDLSSLVLVLKDDPEIDRLRRCLRKGVYKEVVVVIHVADR